ncbi:hypothetical protein [Marilutibacter aestuarii]|uniref:Transmembrane protein n=1 Tax=Marilutibacter aestuarii TaxID=1706195 RepID=A0A507ZTR5_9GAMM|nr:hypothetical protein [Lysobacter aestuarii]TQD41166.1 hypothetical protein FKV25_13195 [Lysobacter aestuarii]
MNAPRLLSIACLLALAVGSMAAVLSGAAYLERLLPGGLPLGNALVALGLVAAAAAAWRLAPRRTWAAGVSGIVLLLAAAWLPVSTALAGNLALNFSDDRGSTWLVFSLGLLLAILVSLAWATFAAWRCAIRARRR